jgi:hypothetical protein
MTRKAGIGHWHAHEGRHAAVSIMSSKGVPIQDLSDTVRHIAETVFRPVIRPTIPGRPRSPALAASRRDQVITGDSSCARKSLMRMRIANDLEAGAIVIIARGRMRIRSLPIVPAD